VAAVDLPSTDFPAPVKSALLVLQYKHKAGEGRVDDIPTYPGLTVACAILFAILCGLGVWQLEGCNETGADRADEFHIAAAPRSLDTVLAMGEEGAQYRRVALTGRCVMARGLCLHRRRAPPFIMCWPFRPTTARC
jgi:cytochrome oxidase assembly protein ShyY1